MREEFGHRQTGRLAKARSRPERDAKRKHVDLDQWRIRADWSHPLEPADPPKFTLTIRREAGIFHRVSKAIALAILQEDRL